MYEKQRLSLRQTDSLQLASLARSVVLIALLLMPGFLMAQSSARLSGTVLDASGAVVPQAKVICRNTATGLTYTASTNAEGLFRFPDLPIGPYELTASHAGFEELVRSGITLLTGHAVDVQLRLQVGQARQRVEVTAGAPVVQTTTSETQTAIDSRSMRELPLNGRNALQLVLLTPGTVAYGGGQSFQSANEQIAVNGMRSTDNNYTLDGTSYTDPHFGSAPVLPNPDALEEFTVKSSNFSAAEAGAGASVELSTRSGTNQFHGSAFEFLRNDALDARNYFAARRTPFKRNQFGGTFGGPIKKDKMFIFGSYQGTRLRGGASPAIAHPPTAAERQGDFSGTNRTIIDPQTGQPFEGNIIPTDRFDPLAVKLMSYIPLPSQPDGSLVYSPNDNQNDDQVMVRFDDNLTSKDHFTVRYFYDKYFFEEQTSNVPNIYGTDTYHNQNILVSDTHTFGPSLLFTGSFGYTRVPRTRAGVFPTTMQDLGASVPLATTGVPPHLLVNISGYTNLSSGTPIIFKPDTYQYRGRFTWMHGKHMVQFGMDVLRQHEYSVDDSRGVGSWTFQASATALSSVPNSGDAFADYLLGLPFFFTQHGVTPQDTTETLWQPWIQDDWKIAPRLTLNLGVRWVPWLPPIDHVAPQIGFEGGVQSVVAPFAPAGLVFSGDPGLRASIFPADYNNIAPRVGFAYDVFGNGKSVLRGAYGIFYRPVPLNIQRFSGNTAAFRGLTANISVPSSFGDPYANFAGGDPFPWTAPTTSDLKTYQFASPVVTSALSPKTATSYAQEWNLTLEHALTPKLGLSLAYIGSHTVKGMSSTEFNPAIYAIGATEGNVDARRPYAGIGALQGVTDFVFSNYNSLQVQVKRRTEHGLMIIGNYVYSKCMDNNSGTIGGVSVRNKLNPNADYGPCDFDYTNAANVSLLYNLPRLGALHGAADGIFNGWQMTGIITARSGGPFSINSGKDNSLSGPTTNSGTNDNADQISANSSRPSGVNQLLEWFNTAAYVQNQLGTFGTTGRNSLRGPGAWGVDMGVFKEFGITERLRSQFRFEAFNFFNHANFGSPVNTLTNRNFGKILGAGDPRVIQFALKLMF